MLVVLLLPVAVMLLVAACDKVPLLAPTGTVISLFPVTNTVAPNSEVQIIATVIENGVAPAGSGGSPSSGSTSSTGAGTPVQNGTLISFTTTLGRIEPSEARTHNGQVTVRLITGNGSGNANITAYSGGASAKTTLKIGTAAATNLTLTSTPQALPSSGGSVLVQATVTDEGGNPLPGIPVTFSTEAGSVSPSTATTDANGVATATLTTTAKTVVTATAGAASGKTTVTVNAFALKSFTAQPNVASAGMAVTFTVATADATVQNVRVNFGDGRVTELGTIPAGATATAVNTYCAPGNYTATATVTDASAGATSLSTSVSVAALGVTLSPSSATAGTPVTFQATLAATAQVSRYVWTFDDGTGSVTTTSPQVSHTFTSKGQKTVRVDVFGVSGCEIGTATVVLFAS